MIPNDPTLINRIARRFYAAAGFARPWEEASRTTRDRYESRARMALRVVRDAQEALLTKRWVCQVARSGYHNGASCRPDDAHNNWGCDYYYEASIRATYIEEMTS